MRRGVRVSITIEDDTPFTASEAAALRHITEAYTTIIALNAASALELAQHFGSPVPVVSPTRKTSWWRRG